MEACATRVREHVQAVILGLGLIGARLESLMFFPVGLPLGFDLLRIVLCHCFIPQVGSARRKTKDERRKISSAGQSAAVSKASLNFSGLNLARKRDGGQPSRCSKPLNESVNLQLILHLHRLFLPLLLLQSNPGLNNMPEATTDHVHTHRGRFHTKETPR